MKALVLAAVFVLAGVLSGFSQSNASLGFAFEKKGDKLITKDEQGNKSLSFMVSGLTSNEQMETFKSQFSQSRGVVSFTLTKTGDTYLASGVFFPEANAKYFKDLFKFFGVNEVSMNGKIIPVEEFGAKNKAN